MASFSRRVGRRCGRATEPPAASQRLVPLLPRVRQSTRPLRRPPSTPTTSPPSISSPAPLHLKPARTKRPVQRAIATSSSIIRTTRCSPRSYTPITGARSSTSGHPAPKNSKKTKTSRKSFIFENTGEAIGVTMPHPHGQIYSFPFIPPLLQREYDKRTRASSAHRRMPLLLRAQCRTRCP